MEICDASQFLIGHNTLGTKVWSNASELSSGMPLQDPRTFWRIPGESETAVDGPGGVRNVMVGA